MELLRSQNKALESDKSKLNTEIKELKEKLANVTNTLNQHSSLPSSAVLNPNIPKPESAAKDPVYNLVNPAAGKSETKVDINAPPPLPKPNNNNANQIAPPPEPKKNAEDKMKAEESKQNPDIIDPANIAIDDDMEKDDPGHGDAAHEDLEGAVEAQKESKVDNSINYVADNSKNAAAGLGLNNKNSQDNLIESVQNI